MNHHIRSIVILLLSLVSLSHAYLPRPEAKRLCRLRTGLTDRDMSEYKLRNENCIVDCITKQGTVMSMFADDGTSCHDADGYKCSLGKCRSPDEKSSSDDEIKSDLSVVDVNIKSAYVADRDPYPTQGESDAFAVLEVVSTDEPFYKSGDVLCHTHVVQDNSRPRWNFSCRPLPLRNSAQLRFVVYDSDKPDTSPQLLGIARQSLESLMNNGVQTLTLEQDDVLGGPYTLEVEIKGKKYESNE